MISIDDVRNIASSTKLIDFCAFVIAARGDGPFPDYKAIDLMQIPRLVPHVWVLDFRDKMAVPPRIQFSGTHVDDHYCMNVTGKSMEEIYVEDDFDVAVKGNYYQVYEQKKVSYTKRLAHYHDDRVDKYKTIEAMMFPCSSNGVDVDYGLGFAEYTLGDAPPDKIFKLF